MNEKITAAKIENYSLPIVKNVDSNNSFDLETKGQRWLRLESKDGYLANGKFFEGNSSKLVVYCPGTPGDSVVEFESKFVPVLLEAGYSIFVLRHLGAKPDDKLADNIKPNDGIYNVADWANEPYATFEAFSDFEEINYISHSFGSLAFATSLKKLALDNPELLKSIKFGNWISVAGETGASPDGEVDQGRQLNYFDPMVKSIYVDLFKDKYNLGDSPDDWVANNLQSTVELRNALYNNTGWYPKDKIRSVHVVSDFDPVFGVKSAEQIQHITDGLIINDHSIAVGAEEKDIKKILAENTDFSTDEIKEATSAIIYAQSNLRLTEIEKKIRNKYADNPSKAESIIEEIKQRIKVNINNYDAHDFTHIAPENILRALKMKIVGSHIAKVNSILSKNEKK